MCPETCRLGGASWRSQTCLRVIDRCKLRLIGVLRRPSKPVIVRPKVRIVLRPRSRTRKTTVCPYQATSGPGHLSRPPAHGVAAHEYVQREANLRGTPYGGFPAWESRRRRRPVPELAGASLSSSRRAAAVIT